MSDPTLEQIAAMSDRSGVPAVNRDRVLARELLALRESTQVSREIDLHALATVSARLDAVEADRETRARGVPIGDYLALQLRAEAADAERDEARAERDEFKRLTHDALDAAGVESHPVVVNPSGHRMVDRIFYLSYLRSNDRLSAEAADDRLARERTSDAAGRIHRKNDIDRLQAERDAAREALEKIVRDGGFDACQIASAALGKPAT